MECAKDGCRTRLEARDAQNVVVCPKCRSPNCLACRAIHEGMSCRRYQESIEHKESPGRRTAISSAQNKVPRSSRPAAGPEKSPGQASAPGPPLAVATYESPERHVLCKVTGCDGQAFVDKEDSLFRCPICGHYNCLKCDAVHESMSCVEYQDNKDNVAPPVHKPSRQSEEDGEEAEDEEKQEEPPADDDAEGMIVECCYGDCKGYAYVVKTATVAQCEACKHWTCVSCKACHESKSCNQYKGIDVPEESVAPELTVNGNKEPGLVSFVVSKIGNFISGNRSSAVEQPRARILPDGRPADYTFDPYTVSGARGHRDYKKVPETGRTNGELATSLQTNNQGNGILCDACSRRESHHTVEECEHSLCSQCIQKAAENATECGSVSCPAMAEYLQPCAGRLKEEELKQHVPQKTLKKLGKKNWCDAQCFDKRCSYAFRRRKGAHFFTCPMCRRKNCAECSAVHDGMTCTDYIKKLIDDMDKGRLEDPEEKKKRLKELTAIYEQPSMQTDEEFECTICLVEVEPGKGIVLRNCHHQICEQCLADTAKNSPAAEVLCPCKSDDADCQMPILDSDLRACLSKEDYAALQERGLREAENTSKEPSFHCKTPDCKGWCLYEREVEVFACPVCGQQNCLRCEAIHKDMSCADYQADLKRRAQNDAAARASLNFLEEMLKTEQAMRCPQCRVVIIKRSGCDWMVCTSCKTQLCWATKGARWGPAGQGDISGGCRCGVNGVKCHPKCTTCH